MANALLSPSVIAREALMLLDNNMVMSSLVYRDNEQDFTAKVGDAVTIRKPPVFEAKEFTSAVETQNANESGVVLTLDKHFDVSVNVTSKEWTLSLDDFSTRIIEPAMVAIAQGIDSYLLSQYVDVYNYVGAAGDPPDSLADLTAVDKALNELSAPLTGRNAVVNPAAKADLLGIDAVTRAEQRGDDGSALREASMGRVMGLDWYMAQNVKSHTAGTFSAGAPTVNGSVAPGAASMDIDGGAGSETIVKGDLFTVDSQPGWVGVFTSDKTASGGAITGATFEPAAPVGGFSGGDSITIVTDHAANMAFHKNAFSLAVVPLELPKGAAQADYIHHNGMGIRVVYGYSMSSKEDAISFDVLCGAKCVDPRLAVRLLG